MQMFDPVDYVLDYILGCVLEVSILLPVFKSY